LVTSASISSGWRRSPDTQSPRASKSAARRTVIASKPKPRPMAAMSVDGKRTVDRSSPAGPTRAREWLRHGDDMDADLIAAMDRLRQSVDALRRAIESGTTTGATVAGDQTGLVDRVQTLTDLHRLELISDGEFEDAREPLLRRLPT
jgi:hypothetical protein